MAINLNEMSLKELKDLHGQVAKAISSFEDRKKKEALAELEEKARELGFSLSELTGTAAPRTGSSSCSGMSKVGSQFPMLQYRRCLLCSHRFCGLHHHEEKYQQQAPHGLCKGSLR